MSWKNTFISGVIIPHNLRNFNECSKDILCDRCDKLLNQKKELSANLNELKRQPLNEFGYMIPWYKIS